MQHYSPLNNEKLYFCHLFYPYCSCSPFSKIMVLYSKIVDQRELLFGFSVESGCMIPFVNKVNVFMFQLRGRFCKMARAILASSTEQI